MTSSLTLAISTLSTLPVMTKSHILSVSSPYVTLTFDMLPSAGVQDSEGGSALGRASFVFSALDIEFSGPFSCFTRSTVSRGIGRQEVGSFAILTVCSSQDATA